MDSGYVSRVEYEEHNKRMDDEHRRMNHRLNAVEIATEQNNKLLISVEKLALNMENMQKEQAAQRGEIEEIKGRDGKKWRKATDYIITAVIGILVGFIFAQIGIF